PKIESIIELCSKGDLPKNDFPFIGDEPKKQVALKVKGGNYFGGNDADEDTPNLIVFVIGGIGHNEICSMERLQVEKKIAHNLVIGSTSIMTAKDYVKNLNDLPLPTESMENKNVELKSIELVIME